METEMMVWDK